MKLLEVLIDKEWVRLVDVKEGDTASKKGDKVIHVWKSGDMKVTSTYDLTKFAAYSIV